MPRPAISVENLSKAYRIGLKEEIPDTLAGAFTGFLKSPLRNLRQLSRLDTFRHQADDEDIFWALRDVSFEVQEGEVLGVIGRNGAGKSTLLKILSRITEPTSGRAVIRGRVSSLLEVGTGFHPELSGRENVYLNGTILGMTKAEIDRKFDEIVEFSGVEKFLDTPIKRYSSGMKVRLAFAVAAHLEPEILIVDEVLAVGDAEFQKKCLGKMQNVASHGRTVLFVSHNMDAVRQLTNRSVLLNNGSALADGPTDTIIAPYLETLRSASLLQGNVASATRHNTDLTRQVDFICIAFENSNGVFPSGAPIVLDIRVRVNTPTPYLRISGTVFTEDEHPIGSFFTEDHNIASASTNTTQHLRLTLTRHGLAPSRYYFALATGCGNNTTGHKDYDRLHSCLPFEIVPTTIGNVLAVWPRTWGHIAFENPLLEAIA